MSVSVFYNPDLVEQLTACGITARRSPGASTSGFVLHRAGPRPQGGRAVTHVVAVQSGVTITGRQLRLPAQETAATAIEPRTALELAEDCARLRRDNQRLSDEVARLRAEIARLTAGLAPKQREAADLDDSARRFALLELD